MGHSYCVGHLPQLLSGHLPAQGWDGRTPTHRDRAAINGAQLLSGLPAATPGKVPERRSWACGGTTRYRGPEECWEDPQMVLYRPICRSQ